MSGSRVNISGTWKDLITVEVNVGGSWKNVIDIETNVSGAWKDAFYFIDLQGGTFTANPVTDPGTSFVGLKFLADGTVERKLNSGSYTQQQSATDWCVANQRADSTFDIRHIASGKVGTYTVEAAAADTWINLGSDRVWSILQSGIGTKTTTATFEIRNDAGTTVATASYSLVAEVDAGG